LALGDPVPKFDINRLDVAPDPEAEIRRIGCLDDSGEYSRLARRGLSDGDGLDRPYLFNRFWWLFLARTKRECSGRQHAGANARA
jgi:hypothetical protein